MKNKNLLTSIFLLSLFGLSGLLNAQTCEFIPNNSSWLGNSNMANAANIIDNNNASFTSIAMSYYSTLYTQYSEINFPSPKEISAFKFKYSFPSTTGYNSCTWPAGDISYTCMVKLYYKSGSNWIEAYTANNLNTHSPVGVCEHVDSTQINFTNQITAANWKVEMDGRYWLGGGFQTTTFFKLFEVKFNECSICDPPIATITAESSTTFCQGGFVNLKANTGSGYTYQWYNNGNVIINATNSSYIITQSGNYTVKVTDGLCDATSSAVAVTVNANPSNAVTASGATTFCSGNSVTLIAQGTGSYLWSNGATTKQITVNQTGNYFVVVTANGCSSTSSTTNVVVNQAPTATITASGATTFCQGGFVTLTAKGGDTYQWNTGATTASINATQSSTYSVIVTANGCSATSSQLVTVNPNPSVNLSPPANFININANPVTLYGTPIGGTYSGLGVSGSSFNPKTAGLGKSTISYSFTNSSGCIATATQNTIVYDTTGVVCTTHINVTDTLFINTNVSGITPPKDLNTIKIFPNPTKDHITINYGNFASMNGYSLKIINSLGQVVFTATINQQSSYIDLSKWSGNGVYLVNILDKQNNTIESRKIVLQ